MKLTTILLTLFLIIGFYSYTSAQFDLGEKIKKKLDKELNKAADDAIDETADAIKEGGKNENEDVKTEDTQKNESSDNETVISSLSEGNASTKTDRSKTFGHASFEGKVVFDVREDGDQQVFNYFAKDKRFRMDMPEKGGSILFDSHNFKMYVIVDEQKMYMETPMMPTSAGAGGSISKTGETKNILGYDCEKFLFKQKDVEGEAWMTKELGAFMFFMESQQEMPEWQNEVLDAGYFPLQVTQHDLRKNVTSIFKVKDVTPMTLSSDLFEVPSSYQKFDLLNMGGLKNLNSK